MNLLIFLTSRDIVHNELFSLPLSLQSNNNWKSNKKGNIIKIRHTSINYQINCIQRKYSVITFNT